MTKKFDPCLCIELTTGALIIGYVEIIFSSILVLVFGVGAALSFTGKLLEIVTGEESGPTFYRNPWTDPFFVVLSIFIIIFIFSLAFSIALVVGVKRGSYCHLKSWLKFKIILLTVLFVLALQYILIVRLSDVIFIFAAVGFFLLNLYSYVVVNNHCSQLKFIHDNNKFTGHQELEALKKIDEKSIASV